MLMELSKFFAKKDGARYPSCDEGCQDSCKTSCGTACVRFIGW